MVELVRGATLTRHLSASPTVSKIARGPTWNSRLRIGYRDRRQALQSFEHCCAHQSIADTLASCADLRFDYYTKAFTDKFLGLQHGGIGRHLFCDTLNERCDLVAALKGVCYGGVLDRLIDRTLHHSLDSRPVELDFKLN